MPAYDDDDNAGHGWSVVCEWDAGRPDGWDPSDRWDYKTLGEARSYGRRASCRTAVVSVSVHRADDPEHPVCSYQRSDNRWHDHLMAISEREHYLGRLDMRAHLWEAGHPLDDERRELGLRAIFVGGNTKHDHDSPLAHALEGEGLVCWVLDHASASGRRVWQLTEQGRRWIAMHSSDPLP